RASGFNSSTLRRRPSISEIRARYFLANFTAESLPDASCAWSSVMVISSRSNGLTLACSGTASRVAARVMVGRARVAAPPSALSWKNFRRVRFMVVNLGLGCVILLLNQLRWQSASAKGGNAAFRPLQLEIREPRRTERAGCFNELKRPGGRAPFFRFRFSAVF